MGVAGFIFNRFTSSSSSSMIGFVLLRLVFLPDPPSNCGELMGNSGAHIHLQLHQMILTNRIVL